MEDPAEDVFVSRVLIPGQDCLIFEGVYESSAFHVQRFVNMLDEMPDQGNYVVIKWAAYTLLRLSNEVVRRSNVEAFATGGESPIKHVSDALLGNLGLLLPGRFRGEGLSPRAYASMDRSGGKQTRAQIQR